MFLCSYESRNASVSAGKHAAGEKRENMKVTGVNASAGNPAQVEARITNLRSMRTHFAALSRKLSLDRISFAHDWLEN